MNHLLTNCSCMYPVLKFTLNHPLRKTISPTIFTANDIALFYFRLRCLPQTLYSEQFYSIITLILNSESYDSHIATATSNQEYPLDHHDSHLLPTIAFHLLISLFYWYDEVRLANLGYLLFRHH